MTADIILEKNEPTMQGHVMRIVLEILQDADTPLSNCQIEQMAAGYMVPMRTNKGMVMAGGHRITDARTQIKRLRGMGYDIRDEWRENEHRGRHKVYWLEGIADTTQLSLLNVNGFLG